MRTETVPLTGSRIVKFTQYRHRIPVHGSLVTVEMDGGNSLLSIGSALGEPGDVDPVATISPADVQKAIYKDAGKSAVLTDSPRLYYYFDTNAEPNRWRLVYIAQNVQRHPPVDGSSPAVPDIVDYVIDAHNRELVTKLPRVYTVAWSADTVEALDGLGQNRRVRIERDGNGNRRLRDPERRVETYDLGFKKWNGPGTLLPGNDVLNPPDPWTPAAVSAHANAQEVADFLFKVLQRDGLDGIGERFVSSVNCTSVREPSATVWHNAAWLPTRAQMVYGQRPVNGELTSYAIAKDVVAHEITHGLTDRTAGLVYQSESGALNESYSDIFGILISNQHEPDVDHWNWEMGEDLSQTGIPLRDLSDPTKRHQPAHMDDFLVTSDDDGGVHTNSGIHNKAAFNLITAKRNGRHIFTFEEVAALFYIALTQFLASTSRFIDSRRGIERAAKTLFLQDPPATRASKLAAIGDAFDAVGVSLI
ncbi:M4 family metallopeptidase [Nocardia sp. XZ_19_231]|uniref:M4 family metallopeptidase n=1 Tax=Nocardia sp. XZ_19_231 TaxID=2769252 RepID=UPI00351C627C